jgi:UDP-N-acetylmuramoylalanine-D-glutamate ligase
MIPAETFAGRDVAVFGLGGSGLVSAQALIAGGANVVAADDNAESVKKRPPAFRSRICTVSIGASLPPLCSRPACR